MYADTFFVCACRSILMSLATTKWKQHSGIRYFLFSRGATCFSLSHYVVVFFLYLALLLLYAEAAWLSTVKTALRKPRAPRGHLFGAQPEGSPLLFSLPLCFANGGEGAIRCCRDGVLLGSAARVQRNPFFLHLRRSPSPSSSSSSPITAPLGACNAVIQLRRSEPRATVWCATSSAIRRPALKGSWENGKKGSFLWCNFLKCASH